MNEHPPIPTEAHDAAIRAWLNANRAGADGVRSIIAAVAPILWREWTRGMAVVPLPEPDGQTFDGDPRWAGDVGEDVEAFVCDEGPFVFYNNQDMALRDARTLAARLLAAADRAEQLAAEARAVSS